MCEIAETPLPMALETETIELKTISTFDSTGIDAAIAKHLARLRQPRAEDEKTQKSFGTPDEGSRARRNARMRVDQVQKNLTEMEAQAGNLSRRKRG